MAESKGKGFWLRVAIIAVILSAARDLGIHSSGPLRFFGLLKWASE
jgi:hypothetical protein